MFDFVLHQFLVVKRYANMGLHTVSFKKVSIKAVSICWGLLFFFMVIQAKAQSNNTAKTVVKADNALIKLAVSDSTKQKPKPRLADNSKPDSTSLTSLSTEAPPPNIKVNFSAKDSLRFRLKGDRIATLYGAAKVVHESGSLNSGKIGLDLDNNIMSATATSAEDTLSHPVLSRESETLRSNRVLFNYKTERGKFEVARMKYAEGNIIGTELKNKTQHVVFIRDGIYSTCDLDHPHYYIKAEKMKVVDEEEVFFTNARLFLLDIPYPIILPFGYIPAKIDQKQSGLLAPTYAFQTQNNQGLGIQNFGWFQYFNDYVTGRAAISIYTSGTFNFDAQTNYALRDKLSGSLRFGYAKIQGLESSDPDFTKNITNSFSVRHNQTISPYAKFNADVSLRSASYYKNTSYDLEERAEISTNSSVGYSYSDPNNLFNTSINLRHSQNFANNSVSLSGPNASLSFRTFSPFQAPPEKRSGQPGPLESLTISYSSQAQSNYQFNPLSDSLSINWFDALLSPSKYREATGKQIPIAWGASHNLGMSSRLLPSEFVNLNANISLREYWHPYTTRSYYDTTSRSEKFNVVNGFSAARDFNLSLSANTKLYGIANPNIGSLKSIRHTLIPTVSFNYQPNFQSDFWGYYRSYDKVAPDGTVTKVPYSIYKNGVSGQSFGQESRSISLSLDNILESKFVNRDTLGEKKEKVIKLIDSWNFSTSYNFKATAFNLSPLSSSISSSIINNINLRANAQFDFYATDSAGTNINTYLWSARKKPFRLTSFSFSTGTRFAAGKITNQVNEPYYYPEFYDPLNQQEFMPQNPLFYNMDQVDFSVPWSISLNFSYAWRKSLKKITRTAILNASSIQFNPSPKWNISTTIGYDFIREKLTPNQISVTRNLHCWDLSFTWNPFSPSGQTYYLFRLSVNNQQFQSLFQKLPGLNNLERSSSRIPSRSYGF